MKQSLIMLCTTKRACEQMDVLYEMTQAPRNAFVAHYVSTTCTKWSYSQQTTQ